MSNDVVYRQATKDDLSLISKWTYRLYKHEDDKQLKPHPDIKNNLSKWLSAELVNSNSLFVIAEIKGKPKGFIGAACVLNDNEFLMNPMKGVIQLLWLDKSIRHQGIASQLVKQIELCFQDLGISYVECGFTAKNQLAQNFWTRQQYLPCSITARKMIK
ncbi:MAG: GNAT family N-acetyltransferase [Gammaproteobacteria bacterium]|nr:GNAT family N-acetyltransferase [Gammaproteobacteria bacterium]MDH5629188.1 GNAT family N-acetyltransferase [Gammaproteobacteria bacterium]